MTISPIQKDHVTKNEFDMFQDTVVNEFTRVHTRLDEVESDVVRKLSSEIQKGVEKIIAAVLK